MSTDPETDFAAWVDHRDIDALTRVFDATAGRLLLLATHVSSPPITAEDLVQATFMTAMEKGSTWDRHRPLWPWLGAILQNEARMEWRRRRRRREVGIDAAAPLPSANLDPAALAASDDAFESIVRTIDKLPIEYRQVLRLRLVHGLAHGEIARVLEVPVGTVRARTHRGLERLRDALPAHIGAGAIGVLLLLESSLLAQVRTQILGMAEHSIAMVQASVAPTLISGVLTMKSKIVMSAACVALLILGGTLWNRASAETVLEDTESLAETEVSHLGNESKPADLIRQDLGLLGSVDNAPAAWPLNGLVQGEDKRPIEGAQITISVAPPGFQNLSVSLREVLTVCESDAEGRFAFDLDELRARAVLFRAMSYLLIHADHEGYSSVTQILILPMSTDPKPFTIELRLAKAQRIIGRVVDGLGSPVEGAELAVVHNVEGRVARIGARSDVEGRFELNASMSDLGEQPVSVIVTQAQQGIATRLLPADPATSGVIDLGDITLQRQASLRGKVVLGDRSGLGGFPIEVYRITARDRGKSGKVPPPFYNPGQQRRPTRTTSRGLIRDRLRVRTEADGSFLVAGLAENSTYGVTVRDTAMRLITAQGMTNGDPVRLVVDRQLLILDVLSTAGVALPGAGILAEGFDPAHQVPAERIRPGFPASRPRVSARFYPHNAVGRRMLLLPFGWTWRIGPMDEAAKSKFIRHDVTAGVHRARERLVLRPNGAFGSIELEVVDMAGEVSTPFEVLLHAENSEALRRVSPRVLGEPMHISGLAPGAWRMDVHVGKNLVFAPGQDMSWLMARGVHTREVLVSEKQTTVVRIEVAPAGLVRFRLRSETAFTGDEIGLVIHDDSRVQPLSLSYLEQMQVIGDPNPLKGRHDWTIAGRDALIPGMHRFTINVKGYEPARCEVRVECDHLVEVVVPLSRR